MLLVAGVSAGALLSASHKAGTPGSPPQGAVAPAAPSQEKPVSSSRSARKPAARKQQQASVAGSPSSAAPEGGAKAEQKAVSASETAPAPKAGSSDSPPRERRRYNGEKVALTFDAGASGKPGNDILKALQERGIRCTFFITGEFAHMNPDLLRAIAADGHEFGNHTWSHPDLTKLPDDEIRDELRRTEEEVSSLTGLSTLPWFRPPYGARNRRVLKVAADEGYECVYWTLDSWDAYKKGITAEEITERILSRIRPGAVVLCHIGSSATAEALPGVLDGIAEMNLTPVRVSDLGAPIPK